MSLLGKDQNGNITKLAGHMTQRVNARWFPCARKVEDGIEYYDLPVEVEEYYKPFSSYLIYSLGFMEPNTTKTPKLRYADKVLDLYDITNEDGLVNVGQLCGVYQSFTKNVLNDTRMYFCGSSHRDAYYQLPDDIMDRLLPEVEDTTVTYTKKFEEAATLSSETVLIVDEAAMARTVNNTVSAMATPEATAVIEANNKTYDNVKYTYRLKFGGAVKVSQNSLKFNNNGKTGIIIYCMSSSSSAARVPKVLDASGANYAITPTFEGDTDGSDIGGAQITKVSFELPEGTFYFGSASGGLNIYGIEVKYLIVSEDDATPKALLYKDEKAIYDKIDYDVLAERVAARLLPDASTGIAGQVPVLGSDGKATYQTIESGGGGGGNIVIPDFDGDIPPGIYFLNYQNRIIDGSSIHDINDINEFGIFPPVDMSTYEGFYAITQAGGFVFCKKERDGGDYTGTWSITCIENLDFSGMKLLTNVTAYGNFHVDTQHKLFVDNIACEPSDRGGYGYIEITSPVTIDDSLEVASHIDCGSYIEVANSAWFHNALYVTDGQGEVNIDSGSIQATANIGCTQLYTKSIKGGGTMISYDATVSKVVYIDGNIKLSGIDNGGGGIYSTDGDAYIKVGHDNIYYQKNLIKG